jgi:ubiquinone/menaquinone biosynthesis C-methylase UbiE
VRGIDYDGRLHSGYARGRALPDETMETWMAAFARHAGPLRPATVLDLGSGTGRFSGALADSFGGPVFGIEPSEKLISVALSEAGHPNVHYIRGVAEAIPLRSGSMNLGLLYFVLHHIADRRAAAAELARVLFPNATLFIRTNFSDRMPDVYWYRFFGRGKETDASMYQRVEEVVGIFTHAGFG